MMKPSFPIAFNGKNSGIHYLFLKILDLNHKSVNLFTVIYSIVYRAKIAAKENALLRR